MIKWIVSLIPWWVWAGLGIIAIGTIRIYAGSWKNAFGLMITAGSAIAAILLFKRGQHIGEERINQKNREAKDALEQHYRDIESSNSPNLDRDIKRLRDN